jgi:hypothetical protein
MSKAMACVAVLAALALAGCGGGGSEGTASGQAATSPTHCAPGHGFRVKLHGIDCEGVQSMVTLLDGRALRQTISVTAEGKRLVTWTCTKPTHSLTARIHCQDGPGYFTIERSGH